MFILEKLFLLACCLQEGLKIFISQSPAHSTTQHRKIQRHYSSSPIPPTQRLNKYILYATITQNRILFFLRTNRMYMYVFFSQAIAISGAGGIIFPANGCELLPRPDDRWYGPIRPKRYKRQIRSSSIQVYGYILRHITAYFSIFHRIVNEYWLIFTNCSFSPLSE